MWAYRSNENILSPIPGYDLVNILLRKILTLHQKRNENDNKKIFDEKTTKIR